MCNTCFSRLHRCNPSLPLPLPGAFFSSESEEKKQKKTTFVYNSVCKKRLPLTGSLFFMQYMLLPLAPLQHIPAAAPAGGHLFFCDRRKEAKEDHICIQLSVQKETTAYRWENC